MIKTLFEEPGLPSGALPRPLGSAYDGDLGLSPPVVYANFVTSVDGVTAFTDGTPPSAISGGSSSDRLVMGLLRALADTVLIGAGTLRNEPEHLWTPAYLCPELAEQFQELRTDIGLSETPGLVVLTRTGDLDPSSRALQAGATVITTDEAAATLERRLPAVCRVKSLGDRVDIPKVLELLRSEGARYVLTEGGPHIFGQMLEAGAIDELFLTLAPRIFGRTGRDRMGLAEGLSFDPSELPTARLLSVKQSGSQLFLRYRLQG